MLTHAVRVVKAIVIGLADWLNTWSLMPPIQGFSADHGVHTATCNLDDEVLGVTITIIRMHGIYCMS